MKYKKTLAMPLALPITPHSLTLPGTVPLTQRQQVMTGLLKWSVSEWDKKEYERVQKAVDGVKAAGMDIEKFTEKLADAVAKAIPDRDFSITLGSFGIQYKKEAQK